MSPLRQQGIDATSPQMTCSSGLLWGQQVGAKECQHCSLQPLPPPLPLPPPPHMLSASCAWPWFLFPESAADPIVTTFSYSCPRQTLQEDPAFAEDDKTYERTGIDGAAGRAASGKDSSETCDAWLQASRHFSATGCHCRCRQFAHAQSKKGKVVF